MGEVLKVFFRQQDSDGGPDLQNNPNISYQWKKDNVDISGSGGVLSLTQSEGEFTDLSYNILEEDYNQEITCQIIYTDNQQFNNVYQTPAVTPTYGFTISGLTEIETIDIQVLVKIIIAEQSINI